MEKIANWLEEKLSPLSEWANENFVLDVLKKAMSYTIPVTLLGSVYLIILCFPYLSDFYSEGFLSFFTGVFSPLYSLTIPLISLYVALFIGYVYAEKKENNKIMGAFIALVAFLTVTPFAEDGHIDTTWLSANGMFVAILSGFISSWIFDKVVRSNFKIKMPETVPPMVADPFVSIVPAAAVIIVFGFINYCVGMTSFGTLHQMVFTLLQKPLTGFGTSYIATAFLQVFSAILFFFGIHGANIVGAVTTPIYTAALLANLEKTQAGLQPEYIVTSNFALIMTAYFISIDIDLLLFCKSEHCKTVGKIAIGPQLFNIGEPCQFGLPITGNPIMAITQIIVPFVSVTIAYFLMKIGFCPLTTGVAVPWTMPPLLGGFLATGSIRGSLTQLIIIVVNCVIYYPFVKLIDKQHLKEEQGSSETAEN